MPKPRPPEGDELDDDDFTPTERRALRNILKSRERAAWLWDLLRTIAIWVSAVTLGVGAATTFLRDAIRALLGGSP